jgi:hypothetical protein
MAMQFAPVRSALTGRPDLMIRGEPPIFAVEVERILTAHPAVRDAAVIGIPGAELGQRVERFVQLNHDGLSRSFPNPQMLPIRRGAARLDRPRVQSFLSLFCIVKTMAARGRAAFQPTERHRGQVEAMCACGIPEKAIAQILDISPTTLRKHFRRELDGSLIKINVKVSNFIAQSILAEGDVKNRLTDDRARATLAIFWMKTRAGWKETHAARLSGRLSHFVSKRPIWLAEAAEPVIARSPTTRRIVGSRHSLSASFTSS